MTPAQPRDPAPRKYAAGISLRRRLQSVPPGNDPTPDYVEARLLDEALGFENFLELFDAFAWRLGQFPINLIQIDRKKLPENLELEIRAAPLGRTAL